MNQTYGDIEVVIVDDGSTDGSGPICDSYARQDTRCKVIHQENRGVSSARNLGLDMATGDYIMFVDSDDWIEDNMVESICEILNTKQYDAVLFGCVKNGIPHSVLCTDMDVEYKTREEIMGVLPELVMTETLNVVWNKVYRRAEIEKRKIRFDNCIDLAEDLIFAFEYFLEINSCYIMRQCFYHYEQDAPFSLTKRFREGKYSMLMYANDRLFSMVQDQPNADALREAFACIRIKNIYSCFKDLASKRCPYSYDVKLKRIREIVDKERALIHVFSLRTWTYRFLALLLKLRLIRAIYCLVKLKSVLYRLVMNLKEKILVSYD